MTDEARDRGSEEVAPEAISDPFASTHFEWSFLGRLDGKRLEKRFGPIAMRFWRHARDEGARSVRSWLLEKQAFRAALRALLPPGHEVVEVATESLPSRRTELAARAHERLREARRFVPALPVDAPEGEYLVWSSPSFKPRGLSERSLCLAKRVTREGVPDAVAEQWALPYRGSVLERLPRSAERLDIAVGVSLLEGEGAGTVVRGLLPEVYESRESGLPLPSLAGAVEEAPPFYRELLGRTNVHYRAALEPLVLGSSLEELLVVGRGSLPLELVGKSLSEAKTVLFRSVLDEILGGPRGEVRATPGVLGAADWLTLARTATTRALALADVGRRVERAREAVEDRSRRLRELDLALLPDDGLRTTLEQQLALLDTVGALAAEVHVGARLACHAYAELAGVPLAHVDAGLSLPLLGVLLAFEDTMVLVRAEYERLGRSPGAPLPFSIARLLDPFVTRYPELFAPEPEGGPSRAVLAAMRVALPEGVNLLELCRVARLESEREVLERETHRSRFARRWLAPLRLLSRELTVHAEEARLAEVRAFHFLARTSDEANRRLARLETGLGDRPALQLSAHELIEALDMRGSSLRARTRWRRERSEAVGVTDLALLRRLPSCLLLPYGATFDYPGRFSDSLAVLARALGRKLVYRPLP